MQSKLAYWSQDQNEQFDDKYNVVCSPEFLYHGWLNVKSNSGSNAPGVDGTTAEDYGENLNERLKGLSRRLKSDSYKPKAVRRVYIPKGDGEKRPLGVPTIEDRVVQESLRLVMEPIFETDFSDYSFGFRPNRSCHDAISLVARQMAPAGGPYKPWILDLDIEGYFDNVDHRTLMYAIQDRITDRRILELIWKVLKSGVMEQGTYRNSVTGTPQGGIISPLLANIYLDALDQWIGKWTESTKTDRERRRRRGKGSWSYVRYADDFLIMGSGRKHRAEAMMRRVETFIDEELNLALSDKKSELIHAQDGLSFLGYDLKACPKTGKAKRYVPREAKKYIRGRIKKATSGPTEVSARRKIFAVNAVVRGWANYYKYCNDAAKVIGDVEYLLWHRMTDWLCKKYKCSKKTLISRKLDSGPRISVNGATLVDPRGVSTIYAESPLDKAHPYLDTGEEDKEERCWERSYQPDLPNDTPYLANYERREGTEDVAASVRRRDGNTCQCSDCDTGGSGKRSLPVHHIRRRRSKDDDRPENMVTLCQSHHEKVHRSDEPIVVYHKGREETLTLS